MRTQTIALLGALALALSLAGPAAASTSVDITYDLSDSAFLNSGSGTTSICPPGEPGGALSACISADLLGSSMKISYTSNSASSMPILHGAATLQSLTLYASFVNLASNGLIATSAKVNVSLLSPVGGSLLSGGTLIFGSAQIRVAGSRHCRIGSAYSGFCVAFGGVLTSVVGPLGPYTSHTTLTLAASAGPYGGAHSTRQTVSGTIPVRAPSAFTEGGSQVYFATAANLVGREVLREAEGHDPKVTPIPEPGTLLLLGAGTVGLAVVGRATRRARH